MQPSCCLKCLRSRNISLNDFQMMQFVSILKLLPKVGLKSFAEIGKVCPQKYQNYKTNKLFGLVTG